MSVNSVTGGSNQYLPSTNSNSATNGQNAQLLQQLEQDAQSDPQAAAQLLKSLPKNEAHQLMQELKQQDPTGAQSIHDAFNKANQGQSSASLLPPLVA